MLLRVTRLRVVRHFVMRHFVMRLGLRAVGLVVVGIRVTAHLLLVRDPLPHLLDVAALRLVDEPFDSFAPPKSCGSVCAARAVRSVRLSGVREQSYKGLPRTAVKPRVRYRDARRDATADGASRREPTTPPAPPPGDNLIPGSA